jgi:hypothetical protein
MAIGSGAAMDLAKGIHALQPAAPLVLIPQTLGAVLASSADETLLFCPTEDSLLPFHQAAHHAGIDPSPTTSSHRSSVRSGNDASATLLIDPDALVLPRFRRNHLAPDTVTGGRGTIDRTVASIYDAAFAALVIALDAALRYNLRSSPDRIPDPIWANQGETTTRYLIDSTFQYAMTCLHKLESTQDHDDAVKYDIIQALIHAGPLLASKDDCIPRSLPYTLSSSLLPQFFPHGNWLSFVSSILPGILTIPSSIIHTKYDTEYFLHLAQQVQSYDVWKLHGCRMASLAEGTPSYEVCLDQIAAQGMILHGYDMDYAVLQHVLIQSLNK